MGVRPDRLDDRAGRNPLGRPIDRSAGLIAPNRVVIDAVGRVGDHEVRRDATEHTRNVGRHCAVAAEQAMPSEEPQIARLRHRVLRCLRRIVGIRQPLRAVREQIAELKLAEPRQR